MNKRIIIVIVSIVIVIAASMAYVLMAGEKKSTNSTQSSPTTTSQSPTPPPAEPAVQKGKYVDYSADLVASTKGTKLLFFYAPWCPQCRALDFSIKNSALPDNLTIFKLDYDSNQPLRQKYDVTLQTTFVKIDDAGNKVTSYTAYEHPNFDAVQRALLP